ncbi:hypothetical protein AAVH_28895 [Aphelenchoides avenae]|nr:hypothetical protein AAVH_28895 [Aphelenchus avenae]
MSEVCLRPIDRVRLSQTEFGVHAQAVPMLRGNTPVKHVGRPQGRETVYKSNSTVLATEWIFARLRCSQVCHSFELNNVAVSNHFLTHLKKAAATFHVSGFLDLRYVGFPDHVTPATLIGAFPGLGDVRTKSARLQCKHIDDALLRCYAEKGLWNSFPRATKRAEHDRISEKGILDFCFGYNEKAKGSVRDLKLRKATVTKQFVANLLKSHRACDHNDPIRLEVADIPKQNQGVFNGCKQTTDDDGSFTAVVPGDTAIIVSYSAAEGTWLIQRGIE